MNLLIADDEAVIRRGLLSLDWKSIGITDVYSVANGVEAKELLLSTSIDLVIFDIRMPGFSGLELAQMVKERSMDVAVVLLSGFSEFEYARSAMRYGVYEYLLKPVSPNELMETMHNVMHRLEQKRFEQKLLSQKDEFGEKHDAVSQVNSLFVQSSGAIKSILTDIAQNYEQNISLADLAEKYHFSESYISRKIKKETGYTFVDILNGIRLMCAASLLKTGEKISDVCEKTGFNDQHYFSQLFKKTLTQLNIDEHNRIPTTDGRLIRRIVRDARTRGTSAKETIARWPSVRRGEEQNIFPFQEDADVMFNSALIYELACLKVYAEPLLFGIAKDEPEYTEAKRLLKFFEYFVPVPSEAVPNNSILREFIGGSCFNV